MRDEYDFSDAIRENPYIEKIQENGYAIVINCGASQDISDSNALLADSVAEVKTEYKKASN